MRCLRTSQMSFRRLCDAIISTPPPMISLQNQSQNCWPILCKIFQPIPCPLLSLFHLALFSEKIVCVLDEVGERSLASSDINHTCALLRALQEHPEQLEEHKKSRVPIFDVMNSVERVIRGGDKIRLVSALRDMELHIFG